MSHRILPLFDRYGIYLNIAASFDDHVNIRALTTKTQRARMSDILDLVGHLQANARSATHSKQ